MIGISKILIMKTIRYLIFPVCFVIAVVFTGCSDKQSPEVQILQIEGVHWACNVSTSYAIFGSTSENEKAEGIILSASDGDLLYMLWDDFQFYYRYHEEDGKLLEVSFDTLRGTSVYLNGSLSYMELSGHASMETFKQLTDTEIKKLSALHVKSSLTQELYSTLKQSETSLEGIGLILEGGSEMENLNELLAIFRPRFLVIDDSWELPVPEESHCLSNLELLWVEDNIPALAKLVSCCSNLESLIVAGWEPGQGELLPLSELKKLKNLTLAESELTSLSPVELPDAIQNLYIISCDTLSDISALSSYNKLQGLGLTLCQGIQNVAALHELKQLQWVSLPPSISQNEFVDLAEHFTELEVLELIACSEIKTLSPLINLSELNILVLQMELDQLDMLDSLEQVELVVLSSEVIHDNPEWVKELRASLPNTKIVAGSGLCLGSGWLLLLFPVFFIFRYISRRKAFSSDRS